MLLFLISAVSGCGPEAGKTVAPGKLDAFMKKWAVYEAFQGPFDPKYEPLLLAALENDPAGPWAQYLMMKYASTCSEARNLKPADRAARYRAALEFLEPARDILALSVKTASDDKDTQLKLQHYFDGIGLHAAEASLEAGVNPEAVKSFAEAALANNKDADSWNYGNIIFEAHSLLGRLAVIEADVEEAKKQLLASGRTPGSPQLNSYGPKFILARQLLEKGERDTVLEFFDLVARFWANPGVRTEVNAKSVAEEHLALLEEWRKQVQAGEIPNANKWK